MTIQIPLATECPCGRGVLDDVTSYYSTNYGVAVLGNSLEQLAKLPSGSVNAVVTSPPYALHFKKEYGNADKNT